MSANAEEIPISERGPAATRIVVSFGFWLFLLSDIVIFSALFAAYAVLVASHRRAARAARSFLISRTCSSRPAACWPPASPADCAYWRWSGARFRKSMPGPRLLSCSARRSFRWSCPNSSACFRRGNGPIAQRFSFRVLHPRGHARHSRHRWAVLAGHHDGADRDIGSQAEGVAAPGLLQLVLARTRSGVDRCIHHCLSGIAHVSNERTQVTKNPMRGGTRRNEPATCKATCLGWVSRSCLRSLRSARP